MADQFDYFEVNRDWKGKWIWKTGEESVLNSFYLIRKEFTFDEQKQVNMFITASSRYRLYINGQYVGYGSLQSNPHYHFYDVRDITALLKKGPNCIGVIVNYVGNDSQPKGGFLCEIIDDNDTVLAASDSTWRIMRANAYAQDTFYFRMAKYNPYQEMFDANNMPLKWSECGFDDSLWEEPIIYKSSSYGSKTGDVPPGVNPWTYLKKRNIPFFPEDDIRYAKSIVKEEEILDVLNRMRSNDLSIILSCAGEKIKYSTISGSENLTGEAGFTIMKNSTMHIENRKESDGIYSPYVILDFGRIITAFVELDVEAPAGAQMDIGYSERLFNGHFNNAIENMFADRLITKKGRQIYRPFTWKAFRYLKIQLHNAFEEVRINSVKAIISTFPYKEKGQFSSSDEKMNKLFDICKYTVRLCSNEFIVDTPWREQGQFTGDVSMVTLGLIYSCFGDTVLPSKYLGQCAEMQTVTGIIPPITNGKVLEYPNLFDYNLHWVNAVYDHYLYTGEEKWIHAYYPHIIKIIYAFLRFCDKYCMLKEVTSMFLDWVKLDTRGECALVNALLYYTLGNVKKMAEIKKDKYIIDLCSEAGEIIRLNYPERFFNEELGVFSDANVDDSLSGSISEHTNCAAILWGLCDRKTAESIIDKLYVQKSIDYIEAQPFFSAVILKALLKLDRMDLAIELIRNRWVKRMVDKGATSTYEEWTKNGSWRDGEQFNLTLRTESHAWSAFPADFLIRYIAGLEIIEPGCGKIKLKPQNPGFDFKSVFPTVKGNVYIECKNGEFDISADEGIVLE